MNRPRWFFQVALFALIVLSVGVLPTAANGQAPPVAQVPLPGSPSARDAALADLSSRTRGTARVGFDPGSGNAANIFAGEVPLSGPSAAPPADIARAFLRGNANLFGVGNPFVEDLVEARSFATGSGMRVTELRQFASGIEVFNAAARVAMDRDGRVVGIANSLRPGHNLAQATPNLTGPAARQAAHASFGIPMPPIAAPAADRVRAPADPEPKLYAYPSGAVLRLGWAVRVRQGPNLWFVLIDATNGAELYRRNMTADSGPQGQVFDEYPVGAAPSGQATRSFVGSLAAPRNAWVGSSVLAPSCTQCTNGNNAVAGSDQDGNFSISLVNGGETTPHFDDPFTNLYVLTGNPDADTNAAVTNLFYLNNVAHDWFYGLGFTEAAGNFQSDNFGVNTAGDGDPVFAIAQFGFDSCPQGWGTCRNNAWFSTEVDGGVSAMAMYLFTSPLRDVSFDGDVIIHEYGHGVSNRLIGNALGLDNHQGGAMGEGWSDYWAATRYDDPVMGEYATGDAVNGIRTHSYAGYPNTYGDMCTVYAGCEVHGDGEIWAAALWDLRTKYRTLMGAAPGTLAADQVIFDGIAATPINPSMLNARDAIIAAEVANPHGGVTVCDLWTVFAAHGFGYSAVSGGDQGPITEAFNLAPSCSGATASKLGFTQQPSSGVVGVALPVQPTVAVQTSAGATVTTDNTTQVTLSLQSPPGFTAGVQPGAGLSTGATGASMPGPVRRLDAAPTNAFTKVGAPVGAGFGPASVNTATFVVNYTGFSAQAQTAFQAAVDVWSQLIVSSVPIVIDATWAAAAPTNLGSAGAYNYYRDVSGAPQAGTWYPVGVINANRGSDIDAVNPDIVASFNSTRSDWYYGTDGNTPAGKYDLMSVVLHEIGHGLGFAGTMENTAGSGSWGWGTGFPASYDRSTVNGSDQPLISAFTNNTVALGSQLTSANIYFNGANAVAANGGTKPKLYAPVSWSDGSSISHFDEASFPAGNANSLMTPLLSAAEAIHAPGGVGLGVLKDIGWTLAAGGGGAGGLSCTGGLTKTVVNGLASFSGCTVGVEGNYVIHATATPSLTAADSSSFTVTGAGGGGGAAKLVFSAQPASGTAGVALSPLSVQVQDDGSAVVAGDNSTQVTLTKWSGPGTLTCAPVTASSGVATFNSCSVNTPGRYELQAASSPTLTTATSAAICVQGPLGPTTAPVHNGSTVTLVDASNATATVNWCDLATDETGYRVLRSGAGSGWVQVGSDLPANTASFTDTGLVPGTYYAYWVIALKDATLRYAPTYMTVITPLAPAKPTPMSAAGVSTTQVRLQWADNSNNEDGFRVLRYIGGVWTDVSGNLPVNTTTFTDGSLSAGTTYAYWVVAYKGTDPGGIAYAPAYISGTTPSSVNANASVYNGGSSTAATATISWTAAGGSAAASGYEVLRLGGSGWSVVSGTLAPGTLSFTDSGLAPGTYYAYWVYGLNGATKTYAGTYMTMITAMPAAPSPVAATGAGGGSVHLTWTDNSSNEDAFEVRRFNGATWVLVGTVGVNVTKYTDTSGLVAGNTYAYWLVARTGTFLSYAGAYIAATAK